MRFITNSIFTGKKLYLLLLLAITICASSCGIYSFKDASIPDYVKTIKINFIENHAGIVNPQLSPRLTDAFKQKVQSYLRKASIVTSDNADYIITATVTTYSVSTSGISSQQASSNRLTVGVHLELNDTHNNKVTPHDVTLPFDFPASQTLSQAENALLDTIIKNLSDEMFNSIFSSW